VSIFSEFCILLIFYFCIENDVQNPHVSVLKFISVKFFFMLKHQVVAYVETPGCSIC
jgi:hypothetical protein